jgi:hypothetical protein
VKRDFAVELDQHAHDLGQRDALDVFDGNGRCGGLCRIAGARGGSELSRVGGGEQTLRAGGVVAAVAGGAVARRREQAPRLAAARGRNARAGAGGGAVVFDSSAVSWVCALATSLLPA